jgi:hypothetical protein
VRFLDRFELADRVAGEPAAADGEAADLSGRDQRNPAVVGVSLRAFAADHAATRSVMSRGLYVPIARRVGYGGLARLPFRKLGTERRHEG